MSIRWWRLKSGRRIVLIGLLPVLLLGLPTVMLLFAGNTQSERLHREALGVTAVSDALSAMQWAQRHRVLTAGGVAGAQNELRAARTGLGDALERTATSVAAIGDSALTAQAASIQREWTLFLTNP